MRKSLCIGVFAVAAAFLPAVSASAATTHAPSAPVPAAVSNGTVHPLNWVLYDRNLTGQQCTDEGFYFRRTGQVFNYDCQYIGNNLFNLWLDEIQ